jgi:transcription termination/antitermination factor NusG
MSEEQRVAKWYIVHTYSGYENKVLQNLEKVVAHRGLEEFFEDTKIPTEIVTEYKGEKSKEVERKLFPGYVLVKMIMTDESWYAVRGIHGVSGFVGTPTKTGGTKPVPLTKEEVERLGVSGVKVAEVDYQVGDSVVITSGPLEGQSALVAKIDNAESKVTVVITMLGRKSEVELEFAQVRKA